MALVISITCTPTAMYPKATSCQPRSDDYSDSGGFAGWKRAHNGGDGSIVERKRDDVRFSGDLRVDDAGVFDVGVR